MGLAPILYIGFNTTAMGSISVALALQHGLVLAAIAFLHGRSPEAMEILPMSPSDRCSFKPRTVETITPILLQCFNATVIGSTSVALTSGSVFAKVT